MIRKILGAAGLTLLSLAIVVVVVYAFSFGNVDGVWGEIDLGDGATCNRWATGPTGDNPLGTTGLHVEGDWWDQTTGYTNTDWNQVRYGTNSILGCDGIMGIGGTDWEDQSGLAFDGEDAVTPDPPEFGEEQPFLLGKFCHVNNPISASNAFESVYNNMTISGIQCDAAAVGPAVPTEMTFSYHVFLDETTNSTPCTYPSTIGNPCADAVTAAQPPAQTFRCNYPVDPNFPDDEVYVDYTVAFLGFIPLANPDVTCTNEMFNEDLVQGAFISNEGTTNCGCVFGMITDSIPTAVDLLSFTAEGTQDSIELFWETGNEIDNLGFNLYRSDSLIGDRVLVNKQMIPSNVAPGSPFGAPYKFVDETVTDYRTYFYWLEDIDIYGKATLNGPVGASLK